jgi:hypothetical protein
MYAGCVKNVINGNRNFHNTLRQRRFQFLEGVKKADLHPLKTGMVIDALWSDSAQAWLFQLFS